MEDLNSIYEIIVQLGMWTVFLWLFVREQRAHTETRKAFDKRVQELQDKHNEDVRNLSGLRTLHTPSDGGD